MPEMWRIATGTGRAWRAPQSATPMRPATVCHAALTGALAAVLLAACGGGGGGGGGPAPAVVAAEPSPPLAAPASCSVADLRSWLGGYMADQYYWYDKLGQANNTAASMDSYFNSLLYQGVDRYSYTESTAEFIQFFSTGTFVGFGYSLAWSDASQTLLKVRQVEPLSPVGLAGLKRGETIVSIDGYSPAQIVAGTPGRVSSAGIARNFVVRNAAGVQRAFSVVSAEYRYTSVPVSSVLTQPIGGLQVKVGYFVYQQFVNGSAGELATAFNAFAAAGVRELIVDLRYNGGGSVNVARNLASMIGGSGLDGKTFVQMRYNARHPEYNFNYSFTSSAAALPAPPLEGLSRLFIIGAEGTASASELVINGLRAHTTVVLIGATTYGKPYGFQPRDACGITYNAVNFESFNALGQGRYGSGIAPDCPVPDDLDHALGDVSEARLAATLAFMQTGSCPVSAAPLAVQRRAGAAGWAPLDTAFGEVPVRRMLVD